jgi:hypothetical protein
VIGGLIWAVYSTTHETGEMVKKNLVVVSLAIFCGLLGASPANAEPGGPAPVIISPANGATVTARANEEITVEYTCPTYVQKNVTYEHNTGWYGYHVVFANSAELNPAGEFATPFVLYRAAPYPINAAEDVCRSKLPAYFGNKYGTYYMRIEREQINNCGSAQNNCREVFPIQSFTTVAPVATPTPVAPTPIETTPAKGRVKAWLGCGLGRNTRPSNACPAEKKIGAFFKDSVETKYAVCVKFPNGRRLCARNQLAEAGTLYVNTISPGGAGIYRVTWMAGGKSYTASIRSGRT